MASNIDPTVFPDNELVDKADLRQQFEIAKQEITDLQQHVEEVHVVVSGTVIEMDAGDGELIIRKTVSSPTAVTLPLSAALGATYRVSDGKGDATTNPISVSAAGGGTINGVAGALLMNHNWETTLFRSLGSNAWSIL